jgi:tRNA (cytidine/uridine-2'-O-)-methyltransferase
MTLHLALYQPDIPQNLGTIMRMCACFNVTLHIIEPCGFPWNDQRIRRAGMDYIDFVTYQRHSSWETFYDWAKSHHHRLILMTTKTSKPYTQFAFQQGDILIAGRESAGVPPEVHQQCDAHVVIPMNPNTRSLNVALSCGIILSESIRQIGHDVC